MNFNSEEIASTNLEFGALFAKTLDHLGIHKIFFSPGSRSTPLIVGIERYSNIELIPVLDERSASFLALGTSKRDQIPVGLICTSGSALTHWFPAVTEACHSSVPLLLFSADRPPEQQNCGAGQTIDQKNIFGDFVRGFHQLEVPSLKAKFTNNLIKILYLAFQQAIGINPGPVHLNFPFREPLLPETTHSPKLKFDLKNFFSEKVCYPDKPSEISSLISYSRRILVIAGQFFSKKDLQTLLNSEAPPVLCDSLSPGRHSDSSNLILRYENLLRSSEFCDRAIPDLILVLGPLPTSKVLRKWLDTSGTRRIIIEPRGVKVDPLKSASSSFQISYEEFQEVVIPEPEYEWLELWKEAEQEVNFKLKKAFQGDLPDFEGKVAHLLSIHSPLNALIFVANSMPIRDLEWFWLNSQSDRVIFGNRGVNGIDGTLGTAIGIAHDSKKPSFLLTGDLAFLHDSNALLFADKFQGSLTIFVINNQGGGIFENLPISKEPEFEKCFATPQKFDLRKLCEGFGVRHEHLSNWSDIIEKIKHPSDSGIQIIEIQTDRKKDCQTRKCMLEISPIKYA